MSDTKNAFVYEQNAKILCFHGPLIYEARVLDQRLEHDDPEVKGPLYRVHYLGWSKRWDEWVDKTRVLEINEENLALQKRISDMYAMKKPTKKTTPASTLTSTATTASTTSRKRPREEEEIEKDKRDYLNKPEIRLDIPSSLKCQLVDDWENVTKNQQLVPLPRDPSISQILAQYKKYNLEKKKDINTELIDEVLHGLSMYFNKAIGSMLLYQFERQQYSEIRKKHSNKDMTEIYGAEHLLRLYVQLPQLIAHTSMDELTISVLSEYLFDVLKYLQKMQKQLFISEYQNATPSYVSLVNGN